MPSDRPEPTPTPADFFDEVYRRADGDDGAVPWQQAMSRRFIGRWMDDFEPTGDERAMVVAAGLGDDAAALAARGVRRIVAFDFAPAAVQWARTRHADAAADIQWHVADLFDLPAQWGRAFDLVIEVFTIQSNDPDRQAEAAAAIRALARPGGRLVVVTLVHDGTSRPDGPPWPLHPSTVDGLLDAATVNDRVVEQLDGGLSCQLLDLDVQH